jgi:2-methylcitrate dehydratase
MTSTDLTATLVQQIASNVLSVPAAAIPSEVVDHTKALIVDSIGCALAATEEPAFARASRVFAQLGGNPDCTVIGSSRRVNLPQAVLLNGILIRSLDLNDAYIGPGQMGHPSDNIAVALSVGEKFRASGLNVIASVALGYEIYCRMQDIIPTRGTWDHTTASALAAPLIAGRLMGLNAEQLAHLRSGESREVEVIFPKGHPNNRMSPVEVGPNSAPARGGECRQHARRKSSGKRAS